MGNWMVLLMETTTTYDLYDIDLFDPPLSWIQRLQASGKKVFVPFSAVPYEDWRPPMRKTLRTKY